MAAPSIPIHVPAAQRRRRRRRQSKLWREWCFIRVVLGHFKWRLLLLLVILTGGGVLFMVYEPEKHHTFPRAVYYSWCLVLGESPEAFPTAWVLRILFFAIPIMGLAIIIETVVEFSLMLRDRRRCEQSWCIMLAASLSDHIVLVGLGRVGFRTYGLLRQMGENIVVVERDPQCQFLEEIRLDGVPLLIGDARRDVLLEEANVAKARSIVLATNDDMTNLEAALDARRMNPEIRVVMRMFDPNVADKVREGFNIHCAISESAMAAPAFATTAVEPSIIGGFTIDNELIVMQRWLVRGSGVLSDKTVGEIMREFGIAVVEHQPAGGGPAFFPPPETALNRGDRVLVQGTFETLGALQEMS